MYALTAKAARLVRSRPRLARAVELALSLWMLAFMVLAAIPLLVLMVGILAADVINRQWQRFSTKRTKGA